MKDKQRMTRREFLKNAALYTGLIGGSFLLGSYNQPVKGKIDKKGVQWEPQPLAPENIDLVAVKNGTPEAMFDAAIAALGGMKMFVKKGQKVVLKPNIGWNMKPEQGANTNPALVKRVIEHCFDAGASKVYVFDHSCDFWESTYKTSGIEAAAKLAGAMVVPAHSSQYYQNVEIPKAKVLKKTAVHELVLESDVWINIPILKNHSGAGITIAMKNLMGAVWDRGFYHSRGLSSCISDFCLYKTPDLNIVDAYTVMMNNGPRGGSGTQLVEKKSLLVSKDIVAIDAAAAKIYGTEPEKVAYILSAHMNKIGNMNLDELNIKRINL